jgi:hypothetical protein
MNNPPIIYGRNTVTGAITQINTVGNVLLYNDGSLNDLNDVSFSTTISGNILTYDGSYWNSKPPATKDYISFNMFGTTQPAVYSTNTEKLILCSSGTLWVATVPDPGTNTQGQVVSLRPSVYTATGTGAGFISLDSTKKYMITATINLNGQNVNTPTNIEWAIKNTSSGSVVNFSPNFVNQGTIQTDYAGVGITTTAFVSSCSSFTCTLRFVTQQTVALAGTDTNISISVIEV